MPLDAASVFSSDGKHIAFIANVPDATGGAHRRDRDCVRSSSSTNRTGNLYFASPGQWTSNLRRDRVCRLPRVRDELRVGNGGGSGTISRPVASLVDGSAKGGQCHRLVRRRRELDLAIVVEDVTTKYGVRL